MKNNSTLKTLMFLIFSFLLGNYAYQGFFSRYLQDDYCYSGEVIMRGFWNAQIQSYFSSAPYHGNRYSLTFFSGISELMGGVNIIPYIPITIILLWVFGISWFVLEVSNFKLSKIDTGIISVVFVTFSFYVMPDIYQILFWRSARLPYLIPLILMPYIGLIILKLMKNKISGIMKYLFLGSTIFITAGFSESVAFWMLGFWAILLISYYLFFPTRTINIKPLWLSISFTILGIIVLAVSPSNSLIREVADYQSPLIKYFFDHIFVFGYDILEYKLRGLSLPFAILFITAFWHSWISKSALVLNFKKLLLSTTAIIISVYVLSISAATPTVLASSTFPGERAKFPIYVTLVAAVYLIGWLWGDYINQSKPTIFRSRKISNAIGLVLFTLIALYSFTRMWPFISQYTDNYRNRAAAWDGRNELISEYIAEGQTDLIVPEFDSINQILELYPSKGFWVNKCAANYYQVDSISAVEGLFDFPVRFDD